MVDERERSVAEKFYKGGSTIRLKCVVSQIVGRAPEYIIWHHEDRMLNYDTHRGGIRYKIDQIPYKDRESVFFGKNTVQKKVGIFLLLLDLFLARLPCSRSINEPKKYSRVADTESQSRGV